MNATTIRSERATTDSFTFLGFPPTRSQDRKKWFARLGVVRGTIVFFEAPHRIQATLHQVEREIGSCDAVVCRELTKVHEEFVRGSISKVAAGVGEGRGEYTVALFIGHTTQNVSAPALSVDTVVDEFGVMTNMSGVTKRKAINILARKYGLAPNKVYEMLEQAKNLCNDQT